MGNSIPKDRTGRVAVVFWSIVGVVMVPIIILAVVAGGDDTSSGGEPNAPDYSRTFSETENEDPQTTTGNSENCGSISGKRAADFDNLRDFCTRAISVSKEGFIESVYADRSLIVLKVPQSSAHALMLTRLDTEQLLIDMMDSWKVLTDSSRVTIRIEWKDVVIAEAKGTRSGEEVMLKEL